MKFCVLITLEEYCINSQRRYAQLSYISIAAQAAHDLNLKRTVLVKLKSKLFLFDYLLV